MDTRVPMHLRAPSTSPSSERMYPEDLAFYEYFDSLGMSITGYPWAGDVFHDYSNRSRPDADPMAGSPLFGHVRISDTGTTGQSGTGTSFGTVENSAI